MCQFTDINLAKNREDTCTALATPGIEPRTPDLRVGCPTDCATRPGSAMSKVSTDMGGIK